MRLLHNLTARFLGLASIAIASFPLASQAAAPGITGTSFDLTAASGYISQPDGQAIYSWGYGCNTQPSGFLPAAIAGASCPNGQMQLPGPTLIVTEGQIVTVTLHNNLPVAAGNTSILFPGFNVCAGTISAGVCTPSSGVAGVLTQEAQNAGAVTYSFDTTGKAGTHSYYSGTQGDLQVEMGLYGALIVLPAAPPSNCSGTPVSAAQGVNRGSGAPSDYRLSTAAFDHASSCYDREYLFQFSEMDPAIHHQAQEQAALPCTQPTGCMLVNTEPYHPAYFLINGRSMPDTMDPNYAPQYALQPYNGNPHMHPGELVLLRIIGQDRWQHPFHEHANHVRLLARDGNLILTPTNKLAGPLLFTTTTTPGQTMDGIFQWTGKGLNWDVYAHKDASANGPATTESCSPDANGYHSVPTDNNFYEWCADHKKALESKPFGNVGGSGPMTLPDSNILTNGAWYGGSPYLGPEANGRAVGGTPIPPSGTVANDPGAEAGFAFMWHSHNEREITTNNAFPGGMMMMMMVDPWVYNIVESN
jgi:FtsP/CotA-like multicopper oxidase with cupredoxin domain